MKGLVLILQALKKLSGQDALWEAFKQVVETRGKIKLIKLDERADLREIENDIKEIRARIKRDKLERKEKNKIDKREGLKETKNDKIRKDE